MKQKANVVIRMGAGTFTASVKHQDRVILFDLRKMTDHQEHRFRHELCIAFREAGLAAA